jgi:signal transduction histidine kinase
MAAWRRARDRWRSQPIKVRITAVFLCAIAILLLLTGAFIYERMSFALNRSIQDVPSTNRVEIDARRRHRDEALHELLVQLAVAFTGTLAIAGAVGYRVAKAALDPVEQMRLRARSEPGNPAFRLPVPDTHDELSRLAQTLNALLGEIEEGVAQQHQLVADASHELRTPLSQIVLQIDVALSKERSVPELREALERLGEDAGRLVRTANDLLLLARADEGRLPLRVEEVELKELAISALRRVSALPAAQGRACEVEVPSGLRVRADPDHLARAMDNMLENSFRHGGGVITVRATESAEAVTLHVLDEGGGWDEDFAEHAFDRFATASDGRAAKGAGLGLAIVAAIAAAHDGAAHAANRTGGGADVWIEIPQDLGRALPHQAVDHETAEEDDRRRVEVLGEQEDGQQGPVDVAEVDELAQVKAKDEGEQDPPQHGQQRADRDPRQ